MPLSEQEILYGLAEIVAELGSVPMATLSLTSELTAGFALPQELRPRFYEEIERRFRVSIVPGDTIRSVGELVEAIQARQS